MTTPRGKSGLTVTVRKLMVFVAVAAVVAFLTREGLAVRDYSRQGPASEKLLKPLIAYHQMMRDSQRVEVQSNRAMADSLAGGAVREFKAVVWPAWLAVRGAAIPRPGIESTGRGRVRDDVHAFGLSLYFVRERLRDVSYHGRMEAYHGHMKEYYQGLLDAHVIELPPLPAAVVAERQAAGLELRRRWGQGKATLAPEPPPQLLPGAPKPKPSPVDRGPAPNVAY